MNQEYDLNRFVTAQEMMYPCALSEVKNGRKENHWMWFIFPQLKSLGHSSTALYYGIEGLDEARAYLAHPVLGARLREISEALLTLETNNPHAVMGGIDGMKLCSSMTLFAEVEGYDSVFGRVIDKFFDGDRDGNTIRLLEKGRG